ncbi:MAG: Vms1/Ankzf1 family peptidyl-tRNA hydrolase [Halobacteriaceae archaeon]
MLDELLGRAALKERIDELEAEREALREERDSLAAQLEAEQERRADAVTARQEAAERVNRLEDRVADLEGRLEAADDQATEPDFRARETLREDDVTAVLDRLDGVETRDGALTAMVADGGHLPDAVRELLGDRAALVRRAAPCLVCADDLGVVAAALRPPLAPDPFCERGDAFRLDRAWFRPPDRYAVALVRADLFAIGTYEDDERTDVGGFESDVQGRHSKGGFSQDRFERRRDEQVDAHLDRCREAVEDCGVDPLFVVGDAALVEEFADRAAATAAVDATGPPEQALARATAAFWAVDFFGL